jgi:ABC-type uncharacterized transport system ATPase subunit
MWMHFLLNTKSFNGEILKTKIFTRFIQRKPKEGRIIATLIGNPEVIILDEPLQI